MGVAKKIHLGYLFLTKSSTVCLLKIATPRFDVRYTFIFQKFYNMLEKVSMQQYLNIYPHYYLEKETIFWPAPLEINFLIK